MNVKSKKYDESMKRMITTINHQEPDKVPVFSLIGSWGISYYGTTLRECINNYEWCVKEVETKIYREMNCDVIMSAGLLHNFEFDKIVGGGTRFISEDGVTLQHKERQVMDVNDYPSLIRDPWSFIIEEFIPRIYPDITTEKMVKAIGSMKRDMDKMSWVPEYFKSELGMVYLISGGGYVYPPMDMLFDFLRGFKGTMMDIRRSPNMVLDAVEALYEIARSNVPISDDDRNLDSFPFPMTMLHAPTYLSSKQFERFFAPTYDRLLNIIHQSGKKMFVFLEGTWKQHYEWLNSLPKNFLTGIVEHDDIVVMKNMVGDNIALVGGMPLDILKYRSKEKCIDYAKMVVDQCAPGGGYMFGTDKVLQSQGDVIAENYIAVNNYIYDYQG